MFSVERQVSLVLRQDLPRFVVPLRALVVYELAAGRDFGRLGVYNLFLELHIPVVID